MTGKDIITTVTCLDRAARTVDRIRPSHVFSFLDPCLAGSERPDFAGLVQVHHRYAMYDQEIGPHALSMPAVVEGFIEALRRSLDVARPSLLFHCHAGASRSPAACYVAHAVHLGPGREEDAFSRLLRCTTKPWPNRRMIEIADRALGRDTALLVPLDAYRAANPRRLACYRRLNRMRGLRSAVRRFDRGDAP